MAVGLTFGSWPAWIAAVGVALVVLKSVGEGAPTVFGFQRSTIQGLKDELEKLRSEAKARDARIAELEAVIANTRDLAPLLAALGDHENRAQKRHDAERRARGEEHDALMDALGRIAA